MRQIIPIVATVALAVTGVAAQDTNEKTRTKVSVDDGRAITMTGCLQQDATRAFTLRGATTMSSDEVTTRTQVKKDVDDDGAEVTRSAKTKVEHEDAAVGTSGLIATYELTAQQGVDLSPHVGKQVQITAVALDPKGGDDDAKVTVQESTRVDREDAPDSKVKTKTTAELPRGDRSRGRDGRTLWRAGVGGTQGACRCRVGFE